jgi:hypothetical protein
VSIPTSSNGPSGGIIAGIVIGCVIFVALFAAAVWNFMFRFDGSSDMQTKTFDKPLASRQCAN